MDKNSITGLVLIAAIVIIFGIFGTNKEEKLKQNSQSTEEVQKSEAIQEQQTVKPISQQNTRFAIDTIKSDTAKMSALKDMYGIYAANAMGEKKFYTIENDLVKIVLSSKGGRPYSVQLKNYQTFDSLPLILFNGDSTIFGLDFFAQNRSISTNELYFTAVDTNGREVNKNTKDLQNLNFRLNVAPNQYIEYSYRLEKGSYMVKFFVNLVGMNKVLAQNTSAIDLNWQLYVPGQEKGRTNENSYTSIYYKFFQSEVESLSATEKGEKQENLPNRIKWVAFKQQFFSSVIIADDYFTNATIKQTNILEESKYLKQFSTQLSLPYMDKDKQSYALSFYFGPNHYNTLKQYKLDLEELVTLGKWIIKWINRFVIIPIFNFLNGFIFNYGIIILILTIIIKLALFPLTYKSYLSMAKMRVLKPQIDEINEKIPADKMMERQQATMQLYKKVGVNPMGGCLPLLLQMPILIAMFRFFPTSIELRQEGFLWATDLSTYDSIYSWTGNIPLVTAYFGNHISLFNILMTITTLITIHMSNKLQVSTTQMPGMKTMMYIMPVFFMIFLNSFSAGLTYYYFLANLITIIQNEIFRRSINEEKLLMQLNDHKKKPVKKSKFQERLEKMAKERGYQSKR